MKRPRTKREGSDGAKSAEAAPLPEEREAGKSLQRAILGELGKKAREMFEDARENPNSDASEMVHILLLTQLVNMEEQLPEKDIKQIYGEQFRRHRFQKDLEMAKFDAERASARVRQADERNAMLERKLKLAEHQAAERQKKLDEAQREANRARAALENHQPMDALAVYNRIAEIVGLRSPLQPIGGEQSGAAG